MSETNPFASSTHTHKPVCRTPELNSMLSPIPDDMTHQISSRLPHKTKYVGWWEDIKQMFEKGLMVKINQNPKTGQTCVEGLFVQCTLCQMAKGKGNGVFTLRYPFNQHYFNQHINSKTHQSNSLNNEYFEEMINNRKLKRKKQSGMTNFFTPKKKLDLKDENNDIPKAIVPCYSSRMYVLRMFANSLVCFTHFYSIL